VRHFYPQNDSALRDLHIARNILNNTLRQLINFSVTQLEHLKFPDMIVISQQKQQKKRLSPLQSINIAIEFSRNQESEWVFQV